MIEKEFVGSQLLLLLLHFVHGTMYVNLNFCYPSLLVIDKTEKYFGTKE